MQQYNCLKNKRTSYIKRIKIWNFISLLNLRKLIMQLIIRLTSPNETCNSYWISPLKGVLILKKNTTSKTALLTEPICLMTVLIHDTLYTWLITSFVINAFITLFNSSRLHTQNKPFYWWNAFDRKNSKILWVRYFMRYTKNQTNQNKQNLNEKCNRPELNKAIASKQTPFHKPIPLVNIPIDILD